MEPGFDKTDPLTLPDMQLRIFGIATTSPKTRRFRPIRLGKMARARNWTLVPRLQRVARLPHKDAWPSLRLGGWRHGHDPRNPGAQKVRKKKEANGFLKFPRTTSEYETIAASQSRRQRPG